MSKKTLIYRSFGILACSLSLVNAQENVSLEKIEVQADTNVIEERKENSIAKRIVKGEELTQYGDLNALEILKRLPGVAIPEGNTKKGAPGKGYTIILIDGEETSAGSRRSASPLQQISPDMIERVEIMTNGSAEYTAESMGGIVNIVLKKPKSEGRTIVKATAGAYGDSPMGTLFAQREGRTGDVSYLVNLTLMDNQVSDTSSTHTQTASSYTDDSRKGDMRDRMANLTTKLVYAPSSKDKYTFDGTVAVSDNKNTIETRGFTDGALTPDTLLYDKDKSRGTMLWAKVKGEHHLSGTELIEWKLKFHQNDTSGESSSLRTLPLPERLQTQDDDSIFRVIGAEGAYSVAMGDHFIKTGIDLKRLTQKDDTQRTLDGVDTTLPEDRVSMSENKGALYVQDEINVGDNIVVTPGLRYETVSRDFGNTSNINYLAPSLHFLYKLTPSDNIRASVAKTVKLPRLNELSTTVNSTLELNDFHYPDQTGNPDLKEEKALSYELRLEHFFEDKGIASIGGFYRNITDKIEKTVKYVDDPLDPLYERYVEKPENIGEGHLWGAEVEFKKSFDHYINGLNLTANATFQDSSITNTLTGETRPIKQTSKMLSNISIDHTLKPYRFTYGAAYRYVGGYDDPIDQYGYAESLKSYGTLDFYANQRLNDTFKLGLNLKNITQRDFDVTSKRYDTTTGALIEAQQYHENSKSQVLLTLEGKW